MVGTRDLASLLHDLTPQLNEGQFVFVSIDDKQFTMLWPKAVASIREAEGTTLVLPKAVAEQHQIPYNFVASWITLTVHSTLDAVGLTAVFAQALADKNISCNVIAGYYHDHIFVAVKDAKNALRVLQDIAKHPS